ncbi:MAG: NADH-quinone oxidoreductase subunit N [Planctomycetota bacterium JB042]
MNDLSFTGPILLPALAGLLVILVDLLPGPRNSGGSFWVAALGALVPFLYAGRDLLRGTSEYAFSGTMHVDQTALVIMLVVHLSAFLSILLSRTYLATRPDVERAEYYAFVLVSASGMAMLAAANDLVNVFLAIELLSIPLYVLAAMRRTQVRSVESGFKYLLLGAFASAFLLFGMGLLFGASGTTSLEAIGDELRRMGTGGGVAALGAGMFLVGVLFKIAAAPFHAWTPDVYEGAPTPVTAFMATATKAAAFAALLRSAPAIAEAMTPAIGAKVLSGVAILSLVVGNLGALCQENLKRLLAYSSIAHAGYMLVGVAAIVAAGGRLESGSSGVLYYLAAYAAMNLGAFAIALVLDRGEGREGLSELRGLGRERPILAALMAVFALAMAGMPPTAGFFGKLYVFSAAVDAGLVTLAVIAVLMSVIGLYYYLRLLILMYVTPAEEGETRVLRTDGLVAFTSLVAVGLVLWLGLLPGWMVDVVAKAVAAH